MTADLVQEMRWYCNNVTGKMATEVIYNLPESKLRDMIDSYYEGGFDRWCADMLPKSEPRRAGVAEGKFALAAQLRTVMRGQLPQLSQGEEVLSFMAYRVECEDESACVMNESHAKSCQFIAILESEVTDWHVERLVVATAFIEMTGTKSRLTERKRTVKMRTYDYQDMTGKYLVTNTMRVADPDFVAAIHAGQYDRVKDSDYWRDQNEQVRMAPADADLSWLDPRTRAKSLTPMGTDARYIRSLDRIV